MEFALDDLSLKNIYDMLRTRFVNINDFFVFKYLSNYIIC